MLRVGDEGLSLSNIDWTVEYDFLGKSCRQEIKRAGRLMHFDQDEEEDFSGQYILQMTDNEADKFGYRPWSLEKNMIDTRHERRK
ncbi:hypothetical protein SAMN05444422_10150 [Halobiforma haloterrestris]|uniref:Uncharacterized protein n=2 Tax=Natronobacterium haloterrestre TaxID=148448 RepID=A0A1I1CYC7_NATHA|nr:hypothetical protein SAMN05444422_10150 [Halobiforma haloterrestris]